MKILLLILLLPAVSWAEMYTFRFKVNGPTCNHIEIYDEDGKYVMMTTMGILKEPIQPDDDLLIAQLKEEIALSIFTREDEYKVLLETIDFHDPRVRQRTRFR